MAGCTWEGLLPEDLNASVTVSIENHVLNIGLPRTLLVRRSQASLQRPVFPPYHDRTQFAMVAVAFASLFPSRGAMMMYMT